MRTIKLTLLLAICFAPNALLADGQSPPASSTAAVAPAQPSAASASPSEESFEAYIDKHPDAYKMFMDKYGDGIVQASLPQVFKALFHLTILFLFYNIVIQLLGAWISSKLIMPIKATWKRATWFSGAQIITSIVWIVICNSLAQMVIGDDPTHVSGFAVVSLILFSVVLALILSIGAGMFVYKINVVTSLVFSITLTIGACLLNLVFSVVFVILFASAMPQISGYYGKPILMEGVLPFVKKETAQILEDNEITNIQLISERKKAADLNAESNQLQSQVDALKEKIAARKNSDELIYAGLRQTADSEKLPDAIVVYEKFVQEHPQSAYVSYARGEIESIKKQVEHQAAQRELKEAESARLAAIAESVFKDKLAKNELTLSEMRNGLGKTREEVTALIGPPTQVTSNAYLYDKTRVLVPAGNEQRPFAVIFLEGVVQTVNYAH